ncbi:MAG: DUF4338 domain-containing protein, partial [Planctomycetes bacterium]|nr:DUF4338 domain-containing protein [Planctomycetota bacterium]
NLASHILGKISKRLRVDWNITYGYKPVLMETFVDSEKYTGHCYLTANWLKLGQTTGRTKWNSSKKAISNKKDLWVYPLCSEHIKVLLSKK